MIARTLRRKKRRSKEVGVEAKGRKNRPSRVMSSKWVQEASNNNLLPGSSEAATRVKIYLVVVSPLSALCSPFLLCFFSYLLSAFSFFSSLLVISCCLSLPHRTSSFLFYAFFTAPFQTLFCSFSLLFVSYILFLP